MGLILKTGPPSGKGLNKNQKSRGNLHMMYEIYPDHLAHHGIQGQKWGVRRYQNSDGSLTSAGRRRYGIKPASRVKKKLSEIRNNRHSKRKLMESKAAAKKREISEMSDEELRARINRLKMENEYLKMITPAKRESAAKKVVKSLSSSLLSAGSSAAKNVATSVFTYMGKELVRQMKPDSYDQIFPKDKDDNDGKDNKKNKKEKTANLGKWDIPI